MPAFDGRSYQARFDALAAEGTDVHGEAAVVASLEPATVLDAGCGTGRVAVAGPLTPRSEPAGPDPTGDRLGPNPR